MEREGLGKKKKSEVEVGVQLRGERKQGRGAKGQKDKTQQRRESDTQKNTNWEAADLRKSSNTHFLLMTLTEVIKITGDYYFTPQYFSLY